ncbi:hypothetical protein TVAG_291610 [Trichomonas vaginalis G3]|uniref:DUF3447 domain-containing protein n=1 Tax=Trichomonas vaginalis (strain ATCC PRA-98 / G3) TaxID=412133 RepID=A2DQU2_TRIV3|nr:protein ubiquitination [Trichomonas vaginalis G3]EAY17209.1 hypothetical protein TVAG_291610 [Trichomonas vaginalis G3]KAI5486258.1 protein ubiquitination [Trichomonas vaginalis G3]|eukprot:XP_001329432.1 hypothetical protein [Trichomonas vaginalis G3]
MSRSNHAIGCDFSHLKPNEVFEYPDQASKIIWGVNSKNITQVTSQIIELITTSKISIQIALNLIDVFSSIRHKDIKLFTELYFDISNKFSFTLKPKNSNLTALLYYKGLKLQELAPFRKQEEYLTLFPKTSPLYYIAYDKVDELKTKFPKLKVNKEMDHDFTPLDCAIKYGSELCFNYLKNMGAKYDISSPILACQGGNKNIFMQMIEDGQSFDDLIDTAVSYHNYEIAEYLQSNCGQTFNSIAKSMHFGNYDVASCLIYNGANIDKIFISFLFIFIIV